MAERVHRRHLSGLLAALQLLLGLQQIRRRRTQGFSGCVRIPRPGDRPKVSNPAVKIDTPATGSEASGTVTIGTERRREVDWVNVYVDGKYFASSPPFSFQ